MSKTTRWLKFEINAELGVQDFFEKDFCKSFFAIQNWFKESDIDTPKNYPWVENPPINGISYQSKYSTTWDGMKHSLEQIIKHKPTSYPTLKKVYFYVKEKPSWYYNDLADEDGLINTLKSMWVEIEFLGGFGDFEVIFEDQKYETLRKYFELTRDIGLELKLIQKYVENLFLREAEELFEVLKANEDSMTDEQKSDYYRWYGNYKSNYNRYVENKYPDFGNDFLKAYKYNKSSSDSHYILWIYHLLRNEFNEAEYLFNEALKIKVINDKLYSNLLVLRNSKGERIESIISSLDKDYLNSSLVLKKIGVLAFHEGKFSIAKEYYERGFSQGPNSLGDVIDYIQLLADCNGDKYEIANLSLEGKQEYVKMLNVYEENKVLFDGKSLSILNSIFNILWVICMQVKKDKYQAIYFLKKALEFNDDPVVLFNLGKVYNDVGDDINAKEIFEKLSNEMGKYVANTTLQQAPILLAKIKLREGKREECLAILTSYRDTYWEKLTPRIKTNINIQLFEVLKEIGRNDDLTDFVDKIITENPNEFLYYCFKFNITKDKWELVKAYKLAKTENWYSDFNILQLAYELSENGLREEAFDLYKDKLRDFSQKKYTEDFVALWFSLRELDIVEKTLEEYRAVTGNKNEFYIGYKAFIEQRKGNYLWAVKIIEDYASHENSIRLLMHKAHLYAHLDGENEKVKITVQKILHSWELSSLSKKDKADLVRMCAMTDTFDALKLLYKFLQESSENLWIELKDLLGLYVWLILALGSDQSKFQVGPINEDSVITIKEIGTENIHRILVDWYSRKMWADNLWKPWDSEAGMLIGRKRGEQITNIFWKGLMGDRNYEITGVENKYLLFHREIVLKKAQECGFMQMFQVNPENPMPDLQKVLDNSAKANIEREKILDDLYSKWSLAFGFLSSNRSNKYTDTYESITKWNKFNFISDHFEPIEAGKQNIIIDITAILSVFELGIDDLVTQKFNIYIPQSILDSLTRELTEVEQDLKQVWYVWTTENSKAEFLRKIIAWLKLNTKLITWKQLFDRGDVADAIGFDFMDCLQVAQENKFGLYSDDLAIRRIGRSSSYQIKSFSSESVILALFEERMIDQTEFNNLKLKLKALKFQNLSTD